MTSEVLIEIEDEVIDENMPTFEHGIIETNLATYLNSYVKTNKLGRVAASSAEYCFLDKLEERVGRYPDISFVRQEKLPQRFRSYPDIAPDLAIEIESPNDKPYQTEAKVTAYQKAGVKLIWLIHPYSRTIDIYRIDSGLVCQRIGTNDILEGEDIIAGFKVPVSEILDYPLDLDPDPEPKPKKLIPQAK